MSRPRTFPAEIYITVEELGTDDEFFQVNLKEEETAVVGQKRRVGRYMLHEVLRVSTKVEVSGT